MFICFAVNICPTQLNSIWHVVAGVGDGVFISVADKICVKFACHSKSANIDCTVLLRFTAPDKKHGIGSRNSVFPSMTRMLCDKTNELTAYILF